MKAYLKSCDITHRKVVPYSPHSNDLKKDLIKL